MKRVDSSVASVRGLKYGGKSRHLRKSGMYESATTWSVGRSKRKPHSRYLIFNRQTFHVQSAKSLASVLHNNNTVNYSISSYCSKLNSVALVRTRTIPTERPPPVGEVSANFCG